MTDTKLHGVTVLQLITKEKSKLPPTQKMANKTNSLLLQSIMLQREPGYLYNSYCTPPHTDILTRNNLQVSAETACDSFLVHCQHCIHDIRW